MGETSETTGPGNSWSEPRAASSKRGWIIAGLGLVGVILIAAAVGAAWQNSIRSSDLDKMESHTATAALLQDAGKQAGAAAGLLGEYLETGDDTLIPQIQSLSAAGVESLTKAVALSSNESVDQIAIDGAGLVEGAGQVIALKRSGNAQGAGVAMGKITPEFQEFSLALQSTTSQELDDAAALQSSADKAQNVTGWLLAITGAAGFVLSVAGAVVLMRLIVRRRRVSKTPSPI